jgi:hypothetical protein
MWRQSSSARQRCCEPLSLAHLRRCSHLSQLLGLTSACLSLPLFPAAAVIDKAVGKGVLHQNTAARRKARLAAARRNVLVTAGLYTPAAQ